MNAEDSLKLARRFIELPVEKRRVFLETLRGEGTVSPEGRCRASTRKSIKARIAAEYLRVEPDDQQVGEHSAAHSAPDDDDSLHDFSLTLRKPWVYLDEPGD